MIGNVSVDGSFRIPGDGVRTQKPASESIKPLGHPSSPLDGTSFGSRQMDEPIQWKFNAPKAESADLQTASPTENGESADPPAIRPEVQKTLDFISGADDVKLQSFWRGTSYGDAPQGLVAQKDGQGKFFVLTGGDTFSIGKGGIQQASSKAEMTAIGVNGAAGKPENQLTKNEIDALAKMLEKKQPGSSATLRSRRIADSLKDKPEPSYTPNHDYDGIIEHEGSPLAMQSLMKDLMAADKRKDILASYQGKGALASHEAFGDDIAYLRGISGNPG